MKNYKGVFDAISREIERVVIGQQDVIEQVLVAILCDANALLEGYPGLAKTLTVKTLADVMNLKFSRIQHTPDLMPSDITGTYIIEEISGKRNFKFQPGPVFANIVLADEINRSTPKTQSALLEAMQEKQVTVGNNTFKLDLPFFVLATQNPIEQEGSLALNQPVVINGYLKTGKELIEDCKNSSFIEDEKGIRQYDIKAWTFALNTSGKLESKNCFLYTLPYKDEIVEIMTKTGKKIAVTKNHPFLVNDRGIITWKKAEELTKEDYLVNPAQLPEIEPLSIMSHEEAISLMKQKKLTEEVPFDNDFAFWIAFVLSDGSIGEKCIEVVQKNYPQAIDRFVEISKKYGFNPGMGIDKRGCRFARLYSKPLIEYLDVRFKIKGGRDKEIPSWFLSFPKEMNREFLKTFISLESSLRDNRVVLTQKSHNNTNLISYMLLREGIISWIRHDGRVYRLKIQGKDLISYLSNIGWISEEKIKTIDLKRKIKSSFRVVPVDKKSITRLVGLLGIDSFHTLKGRKKLIERDWYGSYKGIKEGEIVMSVESLQKMVYDTEEEIKIRKHPGFFDNINTNPRFFAASIGLPITQVADQLNISRNQVWDFYSGQVCIQETKIAEFLKEQFSLRIAEAEQLLNYCRQLLSKDIFYDKIKKIEYVRADGYAFGLTVPELKNYVAGFGGCGINHNTYPLPEAQADRFLLKIKVGYPSLDQEMVIADRYSSSIRENRLKTILNKNHLLSLQALTRQVPIANDIKSRAIKIIAATRTNKDVIQYGASPRASIGILLASKAKALIKGRNHVSSEDIDEIAYPILRHRLILNFEAERKGMTTDDAIKHILDKVK